VPPNRRAHDLDNCLARMKSGLDGLADVLGVDDKHWTLTISKADTVGGMVRVEVRRA
jgi:crossover junction endodeoxyribonuclease RusA